jgi:ankyrin repeat protein
MPVRILPSRPNLAHLRYQAKDLLKAHAARNPEAAQRLREFHPDFKGAKDAAIFDGRLSLSGAQLAIARESGFPSWPRLKKHIEKPTLADRLSLPHHERIEDPIFRRAVEFLDAGDAKGLRAHLKEHPEVARQRVIFEGGNYFQNPSLLEFVAENPVRHGTLPANILEMAEVILDAGVERAALNETLTLVATASVARECRAQLSLIDLLCDRGADPNSAMEIAAVLGELEAVEALLERGASLELPVAAALGRVEDARRLLPGATSADRHLALSVAADRGHPQIVRMLLDVGEDPNRYNPVGGHSHTTPLHQAASGGHDEVVKLLLERGARIDMKDILWHATPANWAKHGGKTKIEAYLRARENRAAGPTSE